MRKPNNVTLAILLFLMALAARLVPLTFSDLPFNIDGFPLARISELTIATGGIPDYHLCSGLIAYNVKLPVFSLLLSSFSLVLGVEPLALLPYFCALVGSISVVIIFAFVQRITKSQLAGFCAALFLCFAGFFVYVTTAAMKELVGLVLLCLLFYFYTLREDWRNRMLAVVILLVLPFVHHLTSLVAFITITLIALNHLFLEDTGRSWGKKVAVELASGPALGLIALWYYASVEMEFFSDINNLNDTVLLLSVCVLALMLTILLCAPVTTRPWFIFKKKEEGVSLFEIFDEKVLFLLGCLGVLYANSRIHLFSNSPLTSPFLLKLILPYALLAVVALAGLNLMRYTRFKYRSVIIAMFMTPILLMVYSALRGLDLYNFTLAFRAYNFIDIPLAIVAGIGIVFLITSALRFAKKWKLAKPLPVVLFALFCGLCMASLPLAYNNFEAFGIQEVTYEYEFEALEWISDANVTSISTDQRYSHITTPYFGTDANITAIWRISKGNFEEGEYILISEEWTDIGAQMSFLGRVGFDQPTLDKLYQSGNVLYQGGPDGKMMVLVQVLDEY